MNEVQRLPATGLNPQRFIKNFIASNIPVVITGCIQTDILRDNWTPIVLNQRVGGGLAQVYDERFNLLTVTSLSRFLTSNFGRNSEEIQQNTPYVRWYTKFRDVPFCWADETFNQLRNHWCVPDFVPRTDYLLPYAPSGKQLDPVTDSFPAKGLFISPRGAKTFLHVDPWNSCAIMLQLYGDKRWSLHHPRLPQKTIGCVLSPGDAIYVPHGWLHQVDCISDSVSITWNFVHSSTKDAFQSWLRRPISEFDQSVLRFFYQLPEELDVGQQVAARIGSIPAG